MALNPTKPPSEAKNFVHDGRYPSWFADRIRPMVTYRNSLGPSADGPPGPDGPENSPAAAERLLMAGEELLIPVFVVPGPPGPSFVFGGPLLLYPPSDPVSLASYALSLEASPEPCGPLAKRGRGIVGRAVWGDSTGTGLGPDEANCKIMSDLR